MADMHHLRFKRNNRMAHCVALPVLQKAKGELPRAPIRIQLVLVSDELAWRNGEHVLAVCGSTPCNEGVMSPAQQHPGQAGNVAKQRPYTARQPDSQPQTPRNPATGMISRDVS